MMAAKVQVQSGVPGEPPQAHVLDKLLLTVDDAAQVLSLSRRFVYDLVMTNQVKSVKCGRSRRVPLKWLRDFVDSLPQAS